MAEVGAMHGDISTFNNVDGYLEAMFRGFRFDILKPEDYQALTQQSETLDGALPPVGHLRVAPGSRRRQGGAGGAGGARRQARVRAAEQSCFAARGVETANPSLCVCPQT